MSESNGSVGGLLRQFPTKALVVGMAGVILLAAGAVSRGYVSRLEEVERSHKVTVEDVNTLKSKIDTIANDVSWIKKYLENNRR